MPIRSRKSSRPYSVIFGNKRAASLFIILSLGCAAAGSGALEAFAFAQRLAIDLARRRLGQFRGKSDLTRIFVLAQPVPREVLQLADKVVIALAGADDEGFH